MKIKTYEVLTDNKLLYLPMALVNQIFRLLITSSRKRRLQRHLILRGGGGGGLIGFGI